MENASKALIIAGAILLSILIIGIGVYIYNSATKSTTTSIANKAMEMELMQFNKQYEDYEGVQSSSTIKQLLNLASQNNRELYKSQNTIELCVNIRSKSKKILSKFTDSEVKRGLSSRAYGVRYPSNISDIAKYLGDNDRYNIELGYNKHGYVWEIWINDIK